MKEINIFVTRSVAEATAVTHPAPHHGDETTALAILAIVEGRVDVLRTRNPKEIEEAATNDAYIIDVGGAYDPEMCRFDHHQKEFSEMREDGTKYSSAGLIWREYGVDACVALTGCTLAQAETAAVAVDKMLIKGIDAVDNGQIDPSRAMSVSQAISILNPNWDELATDEAFLEACELAYLVLTRTIKSCVAAEVGKDTVDEAISASKAGLLLLPQFITGWLERAVTSDDPKAKDILYGVFKNLQGQWNVQALPPTLSERSAQRKPLPEAWRGLSGAALQEVTGIEDAVFCHPCGFICGARSREGAIKLARLAIEA